MDRREFIVAAGVTGAAMSAGLGSGVAAEDAGGRDYYELRQYTFDSQQQADAFHAFSADVALPALNRAGITPVGAFTGEEGFSPLYVLLRHASLESFATLTGKLLADSEFTSAGKDFLNVEYTAPTTSDATSLAVGESCS